MSRDSVVAQPLVKRPPSRLAAGWSMAISSVFCSSVATPVARAAILNGFNPNAMLMARMVLAMTILSLAMLLFSREHLRADRSAVMLAFLAGILNGIGTTLYFWGIARLDASMAAMIVSTSPLAVLSLLALRGERLTYRHALRMALALAGLYLLIGPGGAVDPVGVLFVVCAVFAFSVQLVLLQWYLVAYSARTIIFYQILGMTVVALFWWLLQGAVWEDPGAQGWISVIVLAVFSTFGARLLMFEAVVRIGGGQVSMLAPVETLLAVIWSILFLNETLAPIQWLGGVLILLSAMLAVRRINLRRRRPRWRISARL
ncbi:MAG: DMT family transporter [Caldilineaceae bacterium]|nr:DMT family transporter [Caldilineaceae bacterium]